MFTGSVVYGEGRFHIFYTGHNPHLRAAGWPEQGIMHAVSDDLYTWKKVAEDTFFAPADRFEPHDWRDPFVFWNQAAGEYWMLTAARLKEGPSRRRGCTGLCTSKDLIHWDVKDPFYSPGLYYTHECPDLFQIGDWWYLVFSEFSDASLTRYRMSHSLAGPWTAPEVDSFDGRALYAAKSAAGEGHRYLFGWNPTRLEAKDTKPWQWGGNLVVHELAQGADGSLVARIPETVRSHFATEQAVHFSPIMRARMQRPTLPEDKILRLDGKNSFYSLAAGNLPETAMVTATVSFSEPVKSFGIMLRASLDFENGYYVRVEPQRSRLVFDSWPRPGDFPQMVELERPIRLEPGTPIQIIVYVDGSLVEVYLDNRAAMSARMYNHPEGRWGLFVSEGTVEFTDVRLFT